MNVFLSKSECNDKIYTFQSIEPPKKYNIQDEQKFWELYETDVENKFILEKPQSSYTLLRFDIDIITNNIRQYELNRHILPLIRKINECIDSLKESNGIEHNKNRQIYTCCLLEKEFSNHSKDGFHLIYPFVSVYNNDQNEKFVKTLNESFFKNNKDFIFFHADPVANKPWLCLGSRKTENSSLYRLSKIFDKELNIIDLDLKPRDFSINKQVHLKLGFNIIRTTIKRTKTNEQIDRELSFLNKYKILENLSQQRFEDYDLWIDIGITLFNISEGKNEGLELWIDNSSISSKFKDGECDKKWKSFQVKSKSIKSLLFYLSKDNPEYFKNVREEWMGDVVYNRFFPVEYNGNDIVAEELIKSKNIFGHHDIAKVFYKKYSTKYLFASAKTKSKGIWYEFLDSKWNIINSRDIQKKIMDLGKRQLIDLCYKILDDIDENEVKKYITGNIKKLNERFSNEPFLKSCIAACEVHFNEPKFNDRVDTNVYLLGCENGVIDLQTGIFREGNPEDYISLSTGIHYSNTDIDLDQLMTYLKEVFPNPHILNFAVDYFSLCLLGSNKYKLFVVGLGEHDAGKTKLVRLLEYALGDYVITLPKQILTQKSFSVSSANARPELARLPGRRLATLAETSKDEQMNVGTLKELTGNDRFFARGLKKDGGDINPMFSLFLAANEIPKIPQTDEATWNRLWILKFESRFSQNAPISRNEQKKQKHFPIDVNIDQKLKSLAPSFLYLLVQRCKERNFAENADLDKPINILEIKELYRNMNNFVFQFIQNRINFVENDEFYSVAQLFEFFKIWYKSTNPDKRSGITQIVFENDFVKYSKKMIVKNKKSRGWNGIEIVFEEN